MLNEQNHQLPSSDDATFGDEIYRHIFGDKIYRHIGNAAKILIGITFFSEGLEIVNEISQDLGLDTMIYEWFWNIFN